MQTWEHARVGLSVTHDGVFSENAIVSSVLDRAGRLILLSTMERGKTVEEISSETGIPLSTCYRKAAELTKDRILVIERMVMSAAGKKYAIYRSAIDAIRIELNQGRMSVSISPNPEMAERLRTAWLAQPIAPN